MHERIRIAALLAALLAAPALAQQAQFIRIEAQDLSAALRNLASQTGIQLLYDADDLKGARTSGLSGTLTAEEALRRLLEGSHYVFKSTGAGTFVVQRMPKADIPRSETLLTEVVVTAATRTPTPLSRVPASVSVVTQDDFEETQATTVSQVMKKLPNVEFGGGPRVNGEIPAIRGVYGPSITLLVDGARQNDSTSPGLKSPLFIEPYFLRQAEVLRGPASSLYGPGGNGGIMSFTTLSARDLLETGQGIGGGVKAGYGSADKSTRLNARLYGANDILDGLVAIGAHNWNKIRQGGGSYLDPNDGEADTGLVKLGLEPVAGARIELSHQFYKSDNYQVNNPQATVYRTGTTELDKPVRQMAHVDQKNTVLKGSFGKVDGAPAIAATFYKTSLQVENDPSRDLRTTPPNIGQPIAGYTSTKTDTDGISVQGTHILEGTAIARHRLSAGIDYFKDKQTAKDGTSISYATRDGERKVAGAFIQDEMLFGQGWSVIPSVRSDRYEASVADGSLADNSASRISPKVSVAWRDDAGLMLYGNLGEGFRAPTIVELYQNMNPSTSGVAARFFLSNFYPNAALQPEIDRTLEFGANLDRKSIISSGDTLKARFALFKSRVTDLIYNSLYYVGGTKYWIANPIPATDASNKLQCDNTGLKCNWQFVNVPNAERNGLEVQGTYNVDKWQLNAAYSRVRIENRGNGDNLFSPPDKLVLQVRRALPVQNMTVLWNTTGVAAQDYDSTVRRRRPGYATHDLFVSWMPSAWKVRLDAGITNLFDRRYSAYQSQNAYAYTYQEGRSLKLALSADF